MSTVFTAPGTFTPPATGLYLIECWGAGGNGANYSGGAAGGGGGGGAYNSANVLLLQNRSYAVNPDSGGNQGHTTCCGVSAASGLNASGAAGGAGGAGPLNAGGAGANGQSTTSGGGGGGGGGQGGAGGAASGVNGGAGGAQGTGTEPGGYGSQGWYSSNPTLVPICGGGGGGADAANPAGASSGAPGQVTITFLQGATMSFSLSTSTATTGPGFNFSASVTDSGGGSQPHADQIPAAIAGTMASATTFTVPTGSIANGATIGIFWTVAGVQKGAVNLLVTAVTVGSPNDTITVSTANVEYVGGQGGVSGGSSPPSGLPSSGAITVAVAYAVETTFVMSSVVGMAITADQIVVTDIRSSSASLYLDLRNPVPSEFVYSTSRGDAAPFAGTVATTNVYNSSTTISNWQITVVTAT